MRQSQVYIWLLVAFGGCLVLLIVASVLRQVRNSRVPKWAVPVLIGLAVSQLLLAFVLLAYDKSRMRKELRSVVTAEVKTLVLRSPARTNEVTSRAQIEGLLTLVQTAKSVAAHHSQAVGRFRLSFDFRGREYQLLIGRDSERPDEFWICLPNDSDPFQEGLEIGRVQSAQLGRTVQDLLGENH